MKIKEYKLKTIQDIVKVVDLDNIENFITDFKNYLSSRIITREIAKISDADIQTNDFFNWIDDGKTDIKINIQLSNTPSPN